MVTPELVALVHITHLLVYNGKKWHRCRVATCSGLVGEPTIGIDIWHEEGPPRYYHGTGRAVDIPPKMPPLLQRWHNRPSYIHWGYDEG